MFACTRESVCMHSRSCEIVSPVWVHCDGSNVSRRALLTSTHYVMTPDAKNGTFKRFWLAPYPSYRERRSYIHTCAILFTPALHTIKNAGSKLLHVSTRCIKEPCLLLTSTSSAYPIIFNISPTLRLTDLRWRERGGRDGRERNARDKRGRQQCRCGWQRDGRVCGKQD